MVSCGLLSYYLPGNDIHRDVSRRLELHLPPVEKP
jgi:hypothetical protein